MKWRLRFEILTFMLDHPRNWYVTDLMASAGIPMWKVGWVYDALDHLEGSGYIMRFSGEPTGRVSYRMRW